MPQSFDPVFGSWFTEKQIGSGTDGKVYEIRRRLADGKEEKSVLKIIRLGENRNEKRSFNNISERVYGYETEEGFYESVIKSITDNIEVIQKADNGKRFIRYEEWERRRTSDGKGYIVLIRLERARSLSDLLADFSFTLDETLRVGISVCRALMRCRDFGYIYPNLKPENIMFDERGICKLGDFGSFSCLEPSRTSFAFKRTQYYMSPEFARSGNINGTVDTYALGLVLYTLINRGRLPFTESYPEKVTINSLDASRIKRAAGEPLPKPAIYDEALFRIISKACAFKVEERYLSPKQMLADLKNALEKKPFEEAVYDDIYSVSSESTEEPEVSEPEEEELPEEKPEVKRPVSLREEIQIPDVSLIDYATQKTKPQRKKATGYRSLPESLKKERKTGTLFSKKMIILFCVAFALLVLLVVSLAIRVGAADIQQALTIDYDNILLERGVTALWCPK